MNEWITSLDYGGIAGDGVALRRIGDAMLRSLQSEQQLVEAVSTARATGHTWNQVAAVLGVSRQAAAEKFGAPAAGQ
ncbi:helix-turn-helix domain-containing protein [Amycolatopsis sp. NPDC004625]|uniref:helix-turn-helix domain-containing protein n=1 Tax=Amycolatopsis sp. NPDC004625 TaxID=3154670 RepID=UPI0033BABFC7